MADKVLVTGSTGFLGSQLCRALVNQGYQVRAFHRAVSTLRAIEDLPVEHAVGDLTDLASIRSAMQGVNFVFHVAALIGAREDPHGLKTVTVGGTRAVVQAALETGVRRLVHTSSVAALGIPAGSTPVDEHHTWNSLPERYPYGYAKYLAELEIQKGVSRGLDAVIVNPSLVFGPGDIYRVSSSLVALVARQKIPALVEGGVNVVHIDDVIAGHLAALKHGKTGERYILGGENMTIQEMVTAIAAVTGAAAPPFVLPSGLVRRLAGLIGRLEAFISLPVNAGLFKLAGCTFYYDPTKAQTDLDLPAPLPAAQAFADAYAWFQQAGALPVTPQSPTSSG
jgi:dihydroflavonol-4-reductase